jgi:hypothetical protein
MFLSSFFSFFFFFFWCGVEIEIRALHTLGKCCVTELHPSPKKVFEESSDVKVFR